MPCLRATESSLWFFYQITIRSSIFVSLLCFYSLFVFLARYDIDFIILNGSFLLLPMFALFFTAFICCLYIFAILISFSRLMFYYFSPQMRYAIRNLPFWTVREVDDKTSVFRFNLAVCGFILRLIGFFRTVFRIFVLGFYIISSFRYYRAFPCGTLLFFSSTPFFEDTTPDGLPKFPVIPFIAPFS